MSKLITIKKEKKSRKTKKKIRIFLMIIKKERKKTGKFFRSLPT